VLFTQRTAHLADHAGEIAFPGGKIEAVDASPAAAVASKLAMTRLLQPLESALNITALDQSFDHLDGPVLPTHSNKYRGVVASRPHFHERLVAD